MVLLADRQREREAGVERERVARESRNRTQTIWVPSFRSRNQTIPADLTCKSCLAASAPALVANVTNPTGCAKERERGKVTVGDEHSPFITHRRRFAVFARHLQQGALVALRGKRNAFSIASFTSNCSNDPKHTLYAICAGAFVRIVVLRL